MVVKEGDKLLPTEGVVDGVAAGRCNDGGRRRVEDEGVIVGKRAVNPARRAAKTVAFLWTSWRIAANSMSEVPKIVVI